MATEMATKVRRSLFFGWAAWVSTCLFLPMAALGQSTTTIFSQDRIGFGGGQSREITQLVTFPVFNPTDQISLDWDILGDADPWDRAGSIHALLPGGEQVQLGKFVTGFNGTTSHSQNISNLAPLLSGQTIRVEAFIDTWVPDAWRLNASVTTQPGTTANPNWTAPVISRDTSFGRGGAAGTTSKEYTFEVPEMTDVALTYFASGHHDNQTNNSDEFNQRLHRIEVDGVPVWRKRPWRTDGYDFRSANPTSGRWDFNNNGSSNDPGEWSSDFPRSGWIPGDKVYPYQIDMTPYLSGAGTHTISLTIDDMDVDSFWRVSAFLSGTLFPGPFLELSVDPLTGDATLTNESQVAIDLDGYIIESDSGSLTPNEWLSLDDQNILEWRESNVNANVITELEPTTGTQLAPSESLFLGSLFNPNGTQDLSLTFLLADAPEGWQGEVPLDWEGTVKYQLAADFNSDNNVDRDDLTDPVAGWQARFDNDLNGNNFLAWQRQFGKGFTSPTTSQAVPEPSSFLLVLATLLASVSGRAPRQP